MELTLQSDGPDVMRLTLRGSLTQHHTLTVGDPFEKVGGAGVYARVVLLDMRQVDVIDSSGVNWLLQRNARFRQEGGRLLLHSLSPPVSNVLKLLRMDRALQLSKDEAEAQGTLRGETA